MQDFEQITKEIAQTRRKWLVTGCAGFIGSNLLETLLASGQEVVGVDNFSTGFRENLEEVEAKLGNAYRENFTFIEGDIAHKEIAQEACRGVEIVLHQAALGSVPRSIADPLATNHTNITGFLTLLTSAKEAGIKRFVYASSSSVYGDSQELPKVESRVGEPLSPYAVSKKTDELYGRVFFQTYGMQTIGLRYFNVFGQRQTPFGAYSAVIPKWIGLLLRHQKVTLYGDGLTSRDFTYVKNVIAMNLLAGTTTNQEAFGEVFNTAVGGRYTLKRLYEIMGDTLRGYERHFKLPPLAYDTFRQGDIRHSHADISKAKRLLGYTPLYTLEEGLEEAMVWYIDYFKKQEEM
jgi:UDP-N-acetylglucosamine 4-epimerase